MGIIAKFLPIEKVIAIASRLGFLSKPLQILAGVWMKAQGHRTQVLLVAAGAVAAAASVGFIPWPEANKMIDSLLTLAGATFLEKWHRVSGSVEAISEKVKDQANPQP